jgi:plasmid stabilization system protein ParE
VKYRLRAAAARDLDEAAEWYRANALDHRVALRFLLEVRAAFEAIADAPLAFPEVHRDIRPNLSGLSSLAISQYPTTAALRATSSLRSGSRSLFLPFTAGSAGSRFQSALLLQSENGST